MDNRNPYAPSRASLDPRRGGAGESVGVWCDGNILVMDLDATLPHRCVKCNEPAVEPMKRVRLTWHHPALYLLLLLWLFVYLIVAAFAQKTLKVNVGLCAVHKRRRLNAVLIALVGMFVVVPLVALSGVDTDLQATAAMAAILGFLGFLIYLVIGIRIVHAKKIDSDVARIAGCSEAFLSGLPTYRG